MGRRSQEVWLRPMAHGPQQYLSLFSLEIEKVNLIPAMNYMEGSFRENEAKLSSEVKGSKKGAMTRSWFTSGIRKKHH